MIHVDPIIFLISQSAENRHDGSHMTDQHHVLSTALLADLMETAHGPFHEGAPALTAGEGQLAAAVDPALVLRIPIQFLMILSVKCTEVDLLQSFPPDHLPAGEQQLRRLNCSPHGTGVDKRILPDPQAADGGGCRLRLPDPILRKPHIASASDVPAFFICLSLCMSDQYTFFIQRMIQVTVPRS